MSGTRCLHIGAFDAEGGAARSQYRLHQAMLRAGMESDILCMSKSKDDPRVHEAADFLGPKADGAALARRAVMAALHHGHVPGASGGFNLALPGVDVSAHPLVAGADALVLHWVDEMLSPQCVSALLSTGKPLVWLLHDQWPMTGGCHYSGDCEGYLAHCGDCPQIVPRLRGLARSWLRLKKACLGPFPMTVVAPSRWLADCARRSALFRDLPVQVIPYALDTDLYCPKPRARRRLGLPQDALVVLHTAWRGEERKGTDQLRRILSACAAHPAMSEAARQGKLHVVCIGRAMAQEAVPGVTTLLPGFIADDACLADYYRASDVFLLPSMQDNLPNTMLEAMACGTPVVAFATGGIPDFVRDGETGRLASPGDAEGLGRALAQTLAEGPSRRAMGDAARLMVARECSYAVAAGRYRPLFQEIAGQPNPPGAGPACPEVMEDCLALEAFQQQALGERLDRACAEEPARRAAGTAFATRRDDHIRGALELLRAALDQPDPDLDLLRTSGALLAVSGKTDEALRVFDRCLELAPDFTDIRLNKADALRYAGRLDQSLAELDALEASHPLACGLWLKRAQAFLEMGRPTQAARACVKEVRLHGGDAARALLTRCLGERHTLGKRR